MHDKVKQSLEEFKQTNKVSTSGKLSLVLTLSRRAKAAGLPLNPKLLTTEGGGQIAGAGGDAVRKILADYGIQRKLSSEGGRTSRGSIKYAEDYAKLLNSLHAQGLLAADSNGIGEVEKYWVSAVQGFFDANRLKVPLDPNLSIGEMISAVLAQAAERQKRLSGMAIVGTVLQHLVGAKLELILGPKLVQHHPASAGDAQSGRSGDFLIGETVIHVTTTPSEALIRKCQENLNRGLRPIVVCPREMVQAAVQLAEVSGNGNRIEVYDAQAFISTNLNEKSAFQSAVLQQTTREFIDKYNAIVAQCETDQSLQIEEK